MSSGSIRKFSVEQTILACNLAGSLSISQLQRGGFFSMKPCRWNRNDRIEILHYKRRNRLSSLKKKKQSQHFLNVLNIQKQKWRAHLKLNKLLQVWIQIVVDPFPCSRQSQPSDKQGQQHCIGECSCEICNLNQNRNG